MLVRTLVIDNFDSFTFNLVQYLGELGADPVVVRNDAITAKEAEAMAPDAIVISPGPGNPANERDFGVCRDVLLGLSRTTPTLGVCLGLQGFGHVYGAKVVHAPRIVHGKSSLVRHDGRTIFQGVPSPFQAARYHSLVVDPATLPPDIEATAWTEEGELMGARHRRHPIEGVQFHPESILTQHGKLILKNFLESARR
ncbi:MAG TPA: aminodeoxychorismate/anthranilate synthase component II [Candidatus Thermoplasmatota archaeon]|nr:aminodeoxychorismate/anthranilate synthase component II [Candidatus Thermoplasmatota archaeon]